MRAFILWFDLTPLSPLFTSFIRHQRFSCWFTASSSLDPRPNHNWLERCEARPRRPCGQTEMLYTPGLRSLHLGELRNATSCHAKALPSLTLMIISTGCVVWLKSCTPHHRRWQPTVLEYKNPTDFPRMKPSATNSRPVALFPSNTQTKVTSVPQNVCTEDFHPHLPSRSLLHNIRCPSSGCQRDWGLDGFPWLLSSRYSLHHDQKSFHPERSYGRAHQPMARSVASSFGHWSSSAVHQLDQNRAADISPHQRQADHRRGWPRTISGPFRAYHSQLPARVTAPVLWRAFLGSSGVFRTLCLWRGRESISRVDDHAT